LGQTTTTPCLAPLPQVRIVSWFCSTTLLLVSFNIFCYIVGPRRNICVSTLSYDLTRFVASLNLLTLWLCAILNDSKPRSSCSVSLQSSLQIHDSLSHKPAADWFKRFFFFGGSDFLSFSAASRFMPLSLKPAYSSVFVVHSTRWLGCPIFFVSELHLEIHDSLKPTDSSTLCSLNSLVGLSDFS
jgi:hypothetical protein